MLLPSFFLFPLSSFKESEDLEVTSKSTEVLLKTFTNMGDFNNYEVSGTYDTYTESSYVYLKVVSGQNANTTRSIPEVPITRVQLIGFHSINTTFNYSEGDRCMIFAHYIDGTEDIIRNQTTGTVTNFNVILTLPTDKTLQYIKIFTKANNTEYVIQQVSTEYYFGYLPEISVRYDDPGQVGDVEYFYVELKYIDDTLTQNITFQNIATGSESEEILSNVYGFDQLYVIEKTFLTAGNYRFYITARHSWGIVTTSFYYITIIYDLYPQYSYLSLFGLDGFPLDSKDFKIYLGEDEEISLVNFRDYHGNWSNMYDRPLNASFIDNYIKFNTSRNGLTTRFENGAAYDTLSYNTLIFEVKVSNNLRLVIIYNTKYHEKDYYIDFINMSKLWYQVEVPFFLFNQYQNITNDWLSELGFWISNNTIQISNIRIAKHYNKTYLQCSEIKLNMTGIVPDSELLSENYQNNTLLTFEPEIGYDTPRFHNITDGYNLTWVDMKITDGFNNSQAIFENVSIPSNSSILLEGGLHYDGHETWEHDNISEGTYLRDAALTRWDEIEYASNYVEILNYYQGRHGVIHLHDETTSYAVPRYTFDSSKTSGMFETWVYKQETSKTLYLDVWSSSNVLARFIFRNDGYIGYHGGSIGQTYSAGTWYNVKLEWFSDHTYKIRFGSNWYGPYSFISSDTPTNFRVYTDPTPSIDCYLDSIDFSFETRYYYDRINNLLTWNASYISDVVDFYAVYEIIEISRAQSQPVGTTINVLVSDNSTGGFDDWMYYSEYEGNSTQFMKYKILFTNTDSPDPVVFYNISFGSEKLISLINISIIDNASISTIAAGNKKGSPNSTDVIGSLPSTFTSVTGNTITVASWHGRNNVLYFSEGAITDDIITTFSDKTAGNYSFWFNIDGTDQDLRIFGKGPVYNTSIRIYGDEIQYSYAAGWITIKEDLDIGRWYRLKVLFDCSSKDRLIYLDDELISNWSHFLQTSINSIEFRLTAGGSGRDCYVDGFYASWDGYNDMNKHVEDVSLAAYVSNIIDFEQTCNISKIQANYSTGTNTSLVIYIIDNSSGSGDFDTGSTIEEYEGNKIRFVKFYIILNNSFAEESPVFYNINFTLQNKTYTVAQKLYFNYFDDYYPFVFASNNIISARTNTSCNIANISIYDVNASKFVLNQTISTSYANKIFNYANNSVYFTNKTQLFYLIVNDSEPFEASVNLITLTTVYNKTLYVGNYNFTLLEGFERIYCYVKNNNSLNAELRLINSTTIFNTIELQNSSLYIALIGVRNTSHVYVQAAFQSFSNESIFMREVFEVKNETYRLISSENRQNPNSLSFSQETRTLAILDYFNNTLYRKSWNYTSFIDISIPIVTLTIYNWNNRSIYAEIQRGLGTMITILVPPESSISIKIFATSYLLWIRNAELQLLLFTEFSPDSSENVVFEFGERQGADFPLYDFWSLLCEFFFGTWYGILLFVLTCVLVAFTIANTTHNVYRWHQSRKDRKKDEKRWKKEKNEKEKKEEEERLREKMRKRRI